MEVIDLILQYKNHPECTLFAVSNLGKQKLILGYVNMLRSEIGD
jgi:hypothetical protein